MNGIRILPLFLAAAVLAQTPAPPPVRPLGLVTSIDAAAKRITLKTDAGPEMAVILQEGATFRRVAPGETNLQNAQEIAFTDVAAGDRILVRGKVTEDQKSVAATMVVVMTKADIARKQETDKAAWQKRGVSGVITALQPASKQVTITTRGPEGSKPVVISLVPQALLRRYAPDSVRFSDAKPGTFADLAVGDQVRALGDRSADGASLLAEELVSGSFRNIAATVVLVDEKENTLKITDLETKKSMLVKINTDTTLRKMQPFMAQMLAMRMNGSGGGPQGAQGPGGGPGRTGSGSGSGVAPGGQAGLGGTAGRPVGTEPGGLGGPGRMGGRGGAPDLQQMIERMPTLRLADLKPGDAIIIAATRSSNAAQVTAITLLAGVEPLLTDNSQRQMMLSGWSLDMNMGLP